MIPICQYGGLFMNNLWLFLIMGLSSGLISGLVGLAGGFILIPFLVLVSGLSQHAAQGTYLAAMVPPVTFLGALVYYRNGYVALKPALIMSIGLCLGILGGSYLAQYISDTALKRIFGGVLFLLSLKLIFSR